MESLPPVSLRPALYRTKACTALVKIRKHHPSGPPVAKLQLMSGKYPKD